MMDSTNVSHRDYVTLCDSILPEIKTWQVGKRYKIVLDVEQVELRKDEMYDKEGMSARFKIFKATPHDKYMAKKKPNTKEVVEAAKNKVQSY